MEGVPEIERGGRLRTWVCPANPQHQRPVKTVVPKLVCLRELTENLDPRTQLTPAELESLENLGICVCHKLLGRMRV